MAGGSSEDDAISLNVTPLIDVIFCLCLFFLCSFHFKQLQGSLDSWLPKGNGVQSGPATTATVEEVRVFLAREDSGPTRVSFGSRAVGVLGASRESDAALLGSLEDLVLAQLKDSGGARRDVPVIIDGAPEIPWKHVVSVLDRFKKNRIDRVELAQPMPVAARRPG